jgi:hypothetical protein
MKKILIALIFCGITFSNFAQNATEATAQTLSVEKSIFGVQLGILSLTVHNEARLADKVALRSEIGFGSGLYSGYNDDVDFFMAPILIIEPKFYYNFKKRVSKSKDISGNSGNFLSLKTTYAPDWFVITSADINVPNQISIIPTWGLRRNIGENFNYEAGFGLGWLHEFSNTNNGYTIPANNEVTVNLSFQIGYKF